MVLAVAIVADGPGERGGAVLILIKGPDLPARYCDGFAWPERKLAMLGQATRSSADVARAGSPAEADPRETPCGKARQRLQSRVGNGAAVLFERCGRERRCPAGVCLARSDQAADAVFIVLDGVVGLYHQASSGNRDVLGYGYAGDLIAPARLGGAWGFDAKALTGCTLLAVSLEEVRARAAGDGKLLWLLFEVACAELVRRTARLRSYWFLPVKARLASFLLEMDEAVGRQSERGLVVDLPMFRDEIATYLGTRTETICRILTGWKERGLIVMDSPRKLVIPDVARLRQDAFA